MTVRRPIVVFVATRHFAIHSFCQQLIPAFAEANWRIVAAGLSDSYSSRLRTQGVQVESVDFRRGSVAPYADSRALVQLANCYRRYEPDLIHHFHPKPMILGNLAAHVTKNATVFNTISGVGYAFSNGGIARNLATLGYKSSLKRSDMNIFVNRDDHELFLREQWLPEDKSALVISHGVDTERFHPPHDANHQCDEPLRILMVSRLLKQKGVGQFVEAARRVRQDFTNVQFQLAGEWDREHPDSISEDLIQRAVADGTIEFRGYVNNMPEHLRQVSLFVLPSYYREGVPRVLLEAAASGLPVITTDVPGCRETVIDGQTGFVVPPKNEIALAEAIKNVIRDYELRRRMSRNAREWVEKDFDLQVITDKYLELYAHKGVKITGRKS